jgi:tetratricopeptide (TPR) repeat protein
MHIGFKEEEAMNKNGIVALIITALVATFATPVFSAEELFDTATATKHIEQGITQLKAKKYDAAVKEFEESAVINPDAEAYYYLGYTYYLKGRSGEEESRKKSREYFDKAYEIEPNFSPFRFKSADAAQAGMKRQEAPVNAEPQESGTMTHPSQPTEAVSPQPEPQKQ